MKKLTITAALTAVLCAAGGALAAGTDATATQTITATLNSYAKLTVGTPAGFTSNDPDTAPAAVSAVISASVRQVKAGGAILSVTGADLVGASDATKKIPASDIQLTKTSGDAAFPATFGLTTASQQLASFATSGQFSGTYDYSLATTAAAFWALPSDTYSGIQNFTLTAP